MCPKCCNSLDTLKHLEYYRGNNKTKPTPSRLGALGGFCGLAGGAGSPRGRKTRPDRRSVRPAQRPTGFVGNETAWSLATWLPRLCPTSSSPGSRRCFVPSTTSRLRLSLRRGAAPQSSAEAVLGSSSVCGTRWGGSCCGSWSRSVRVTARCPSGRRPSGAIRRGAVGVGGGSAARLRFRTFFETAPLRRLGSPERGPGESVRGGHPRSLLPRGDSPSRAGHPARRLFLLPRAPVAWKPKGEAFQDVIY